MAQIEISESTFNEVRDFVLSQGLPESAVASFIDATLRHAVEAKRPAMEKLVEKFGRFRGVLRDTTIEEIVADRHRGLA